MKFKEGQILHGLTLLRRLRYKGSTRNYYGWEVLLSSGDVRLIKEQVLQKLKPNHRFNGTQSPADWLYVHYKNAANLRGYNFNVSKDQFDALISSKCDYCNDPGSNMHKGFSYNGIDRKDNSIGYEPDNVVPCCKVCNRIKSDLLTYEETKAAMSAVMRVRNK